MHLKQAERHGWTVVIGLATIAVILGAGAGWSGAVSFWAGALVVAGQGLLAGLALWGMTLSRQQEELAEGPPMVASAAAAPSSVGGGGFRMSYGDDAPVAVPTAEGGPGEVRTLETGFQRLVVGLSGAALMGLAVVVGYLVSRNFTNIEPGKGIALPPIDELGLVEALGSLGIFWGLYSLMRGRRAEPAWAANGREAIAGMLTMGMPGMVAVAAAVVGGYFRMGYAGEAAGSVVALLLLIQALELLVNAARSYAAIEEFDQDPVDLQATPLVPMLTSFWLGGVKMLLAASVGLDVGLRREGMDEERVLARMMPRILIALVLLMLVMTTVRVVGSGEVAIRERLGQASDADIDHPMLPGLHFVAPWPVDQLVRIPTGRLGQVTVGVEEEPQTVEVDVNGRKVKQPLDFSFWGFRHGGGEGGVTEPDFVTGDPVTQLVGAFVTAWWKVKGGTGPSDFYRHVSSGEFYERVEEVGLTGEKTYRIVARPTYEALLRETASWAVTKTLSTHTLENVMEKDRAEVEWHCRQIMQERLDALVSGIEVVDLTIKDVHPPVGKGRLETAVGQALGPAAAYEDLVAAREYKERRISEAEAYRIVLDKRADAEASRKLAEAEAYKQSRIERARGEVLRRDAMAKEFAANREVGRRWMIYRALDEMLPQATKILLGPGVEPPQIWQPGKDTNAVPGRGAPPPGN